MPPREPKRVPTKEVFKQHPEWFEEGVLLASSSWKSPRRVLYFDGVAVDLTPSLKLATPVVPAKTLPRDVERFDG